LVFFVWFYSVFGVTLWYKKNWKLIYMFLCFLLVDLGCMFETIAKSWDKSNKLWISSFGKSAHMWDWKLWFCCLFKFGIKTVLNHLYLLWVKKYWVWCEKENFFDMESFFFVVWTNDKFYVCVGEILLFFHEIEAFWIIARFVVLRFLKVCAAMLSKFMTIEILNLELYFLNQTIPFPSLYEY